MAFFYVQGEGGVLELEVYYGSTNNNSLDYFSNPEFMPCLGTYDLYNDYCLKDSDGNIVYDGNGDYVVGKYWNSSGQYIYSQPDSSGDDWTGTNLYEYYTLYSADLLLGSILSECFPSEDSAVKYEELYMDDGSSNYNQLESIPVQSGYNFKGIKDYSENMIYNENGNYVVGTYWTSSGTWIGTSMGTMGWINVEAVWEEKPDTNYCLTVNYYSNYADRVRDMKAGETETGHELDSTQNVLIRSDKYYREYEYYDSLRNYSGHDNQNTLVMRRIGYLPTRYWNTKPDGSGYRFFEGIASTEPITGEEMAEMLGIDLTQGDADADVYPEWVPQTEVYICNDGTIWASDFIVDSEISIDENAYFRASDFIYAEEFSFDENGNVYGQFKGGSPDYPIAAII